MFLSLLIFAFCTKKYFNLQNKKFCSSTIKLKNYHKNNMRQLILNTISNTSKRLCSRTFQLPLASLSTVSLSTSQSLSLLTPTTSSSFHCNHNQQPFRRWLSTNPRINVFGKTGDNDEEDFSFDDDDEVEEEVVVIDEKKMTPEEEAKITAQVEELYAQELAKIEAKPRHQRKYQLPLGFENEGDHIKLRAAESQYIMYGDMTEQIEEEVEADADLMGIEEGGEEESTDEKKEEADTLMAGTDTPHATRTPTSQGDAGPQFDDVMSPTWYDEKRERRHAKLGKLRRRGKGPPKKGSGKRSSK